MVAVRTVKPGRAEYTQLATVRVSKSKNIVISKCSKGGFTIAQQLVVADDSNEVSVFLKGAYHIRDLKALEGVRDAISEAIEAARDMGIDEPGDGVAWDDEDDSDDDAKVG